MAQILHLKSYFMFDEFDEVTEISPLPMKLIMISIWKIKSSLNYWTERKS